MSVDGRKCKSTGEASIADWMLYNGIPFEYEPRYDGNTGGARYRPDFHIIGTDIYIEYYGIDEDGNVPPYFSWTKEQYHDSMEWKREIHRMNGTHLIELYAYQNSDGTMYDALDRALARLGVGKHPNAPRKVGRVSMSWRSGRP